MEDGESKTVSDSGNHDDNVLTVGQSEEVISRGVGPKISTAFPWALVACR